MPPFRGGREFDPSIHAYVDKEGNASKENTGSFVMKSAARKFEKSKKEAADINKQRGLLRRIFGTSISATDLLQEEAAKDDKERDVKNIRVYLEKLKGEKIIRDFVLYVLPAETLEPFEVLHKIGGEIVISGAINGIDFALSSIGDSYYDGELIDKEKSKDIFYAFSYLLGLNKDENTNVEIGKR